MSLEILLPEPQLEMEVPGNVEPSQLIEVDPLAVNLEQEKTSVPEFELEMEVFECPVSPGFDKDPLAVNFKQENRFVHESELRMEVSENLESPEVITADPLAFEHQESFQSSIDPFLSVVELEPEPENGFEAEVSSEFGTKSSRHEDVLLDTDLIKIEEGFTETVVCSETDTSISRYISMAENVTQNSTKGFTHEPVVELSNELSPARETFISPSVSTESVKLPSRPVRAALNVSTFSKIKEQVKEITHSGKKADLIVPKLTIINERLTVPKMKPLVPKTTTKSIKKRSSAVNTSKGKRSKLAAEPAVNGLNVSNINDSTHSPVGTQTSGQTSELTRRRQEAASKPALKVSLQSIVNNEKNAKPVYVCSICSPPKHFSNKLILEWHVKMLHVTWSCEFCKKSRDSLEEHKKFIHHQQCKFCGKTFNLVSQLIKHLKKVHNSIISDLSNKTNSKKRLKKVHDSIISDLSNKKHPEKNLEKVCDSIISDSSVKKDPKKNLKIVHDSIISDLSNKRYPKRNLEKEHNSIISDSSNKKDPKNHLEKVHDSIISDLSDKKDPSLGTVAGCQGASLSLRAEGKGQQNLSEEKETGIMTNLQESSNRRTYKFVNSLNQTKFTVNGFPMPSVFVLTRETTITDQNNQSELIPKESQPEQNADSTLNVEQTSAEKNLETLKKTVPGKSSIAKKAIKKKKLSELKTAALDAGKQLKVINVTFSSHPLSRKQVVRKDKIHFIEGPGWGCDICGVFFTRRRSLREHKSFIHYDDLNEFVCKICHKSFESAKILGEHRCGLYRYKCPVCKKMYANMAVYEEHYSFVHSEHPDAYTCLECSPLKHFDRKSELYSHVIAQHVRKYLFPCKACGQKITGRHMAKHMRIHQRKKLECILCKKFFTAEASLYNHLKTHSTSKNDVFPCKFCGKCFELKPDYVKHLKEHENERSFICEHCGKAFFSQWHLSSHIRIHEEKQFICANCNKGFVYKHQLAAHLRTIACGGDSKISSKRSNKLKKVGKKRKTKVKLGNKSNF